jgi:hypothetical protein
MFNLDDVFFLLRTMLCFFFFWACVQNCLYGPALHVEWACIRVAPRLHFCPDFM